MMKSFLAVCLSVGAACADIDAFRMQDPRNIANGVRIPSGGNYTDQPYVAVLEDGRWICVMTTGKGLEGQAGQHIVATLSEDKGKTWSEPVALEQPSGPEASWATPLVTPYGRVYVFYVFNGDEVVTLPGSDKRVRSDSHGWYCFRYTDDGGKTWSAQRHRIPLRTTAVDRRNPWQGETQHFWGIDKPCEQNGKVYFAITKLGKFFVKDGEGWVIESDNILTERDPDKIHFKLLPDGDEGIRNPDLGAVQEEFNVKPTGENGLLLVCRTAQGTPAQALSADGGHTWSALETMRYAPGGRAVKNPRACPRLFRTSDGKFLLWYHNNGGKSWSGRNPVFLTGGVFEDGAVRWSEPELVLFSENPKMRISYPDLVEQDGEYWLTETQKTTARIHAVPKDLLEGIWAQGTNNAVAQSALALEKRNEDGQDFSPTVPFAFGKFDNGGFSVELAFELSEFVPGKVLFSTRGKDGKGIAVETATVAESPVVRFSMNDGRRECSWQTDPGAFKDTAGKHHVVFIVDASAQIIFAMLDGALCDGGEAREYGFGRMPAEFGEVKGAFQAEADGAVKLLRLYERALRTSEAVANFRSL